jgi:hypothetical protein
MRDYADCEMYTHEPQVTSAAPGMGLSSPSFDASAKHSTWTT